MAEFQVLRESLVESRIVDSEVPGLASGDILLAIDRFAFTANNVTYGVVGDRLGYWQFFPAAAEDGRGWGVLPVWGFADVVESRCADIEIGERIYGYLPPATQLLMHPGKCSDLHIVEAAEHRAKLPPAYNRYRRVLNESGYDKSQDELQALLFPLYITSFCLWDALKAAQWHGAEQIVVLSASSKTSVGLAFALHDDANAPPVTGVTSARNIGVLQSLGLYNNSIGYDAVDSIENIPTVIVDMSGNSAVLGAVHSHLGDNMRRTINVGITHRDQRGAHNGIITERSEFFFAPEHLQKRYREWGPVGFEQRSKQFMQKAIAHSNRWLKVRRLQGLDGLMSVYQEVCSGDVAADSGLIIEM